MRQILFCIFFLLIETSLLAQKNISEKKISYYSDEKPLKEIINDISKQYSVNFFYSTSRIKVNEKISINVTDVSLDELLKIICTQAGLKYKLNRNNIVLSPEEKAATSDIFIVSGIVYDSITGERLTGANIIVSDLQKGTTSNSYGFYSYALPEGIYTIICSFIGYKTKSIITDISKDTDIQFKLQPEVVELKEIELRAGKLDKINSVHLGTDELPLAMMRTQPSLLGENDIIHGLKMLPGIQSNTDGFNGLFVRGGTPLHSSFVLDDAPIFNIYHISGWFSSINPDAVKDVSIYKSHLPSKTGGSLSSIVDISLRDGNNQKYNVSGGIGTLTSRLTVEGPIIKNKASFIISGRRSYIDKLLDIFNIKSEGSFYFYDCNGKINYSINRRNRLFLSSYLSKDVLIDSGGISWGNTLYSLRWNHLFSDNLFSNLTVSGSNVKHKIQQDIDDTYLYTLNTGINYYSLKYDFNFFTRDNKKINFGLNTHYHEIIPLNNKEPVSDEFSISLGNKVNKRVICNLYSDAEFSLGQKISLEAGIRLSYVQSIDKFSHYAEINPEPLLTFQYKIKKSSALKASYSRNYQYNHGASIFELVIPFERLMFSDDTLRAQYADNISAGFFYHNEKHSFDLAVEPFVSLMKNQYRFISQDDILIGRNYYNSAIKGETDIYGIELSLRKTEGKFTGLLSYTWSKISKQEFNDNDIITFNPFYERRHDVSLSGSYELTKRLNVSASWVYMSGNPYNQPHSKYEIRGVEIPLFSDGLYNSRMPAYHRMDFGLRYKLGKWKKLKHSFSFSVYNLYSQTNSLFYFYSDSGSFRMHRFYGIKIFPSFSYEFSFR